MTVLPRRHYRRQARLRSRAGREEFELLVFALHGFREDAVGGADAVTLVEFASDPCTCKGTLRTDIVVGGEGQ